MKMLQTNELVTGYYLEFEKKVACVSGIYGPDISIVIDGHKSKVNRKRINPLPISYDILKKFGFKKKGTKTLELWLSKNGTRKIIFHKHVGISLILRGLNSHRLEHIKYAHQVQGLYVALTGNQLKFNSSSEEEQGGLFETNIPSIQA